MYEHDGTLYFNPGELRACLDECQRLKESGEMPQDSIEYLIRSNITIRFDDKISLETR